MRKASTRSSSASNASPEKSLVTGMLLLVGVLALFAYLMWPTTSDDTVDANSSADAPASAANQPEQKQTESQTRNTAEKEDPTSRRISRSPSKPAPASSGNGNSAKSQSENSPPGSGAPSDEDASPPARRPSQSFSLPDKLLRPVNDIPLIDRKKSDLHAADLKVLEFINDRRGRASLKKLPTLPTGLNDKETLKLLNAMRAHKGREPLSEMPKGARRPPR